MTGVVGTVYLLHFDRPYKHARHYLGWADDLARRLAAHGTRRGARLLQVLREQGIGWQLARTWPGTRDRERQIKNMGGLSRCCPLCGITPRNLNGDHPAGRDPDPVGTWRRSPQRADPPCGRHPRCPPVPGTAQASR